MIAETMSPVAGTESGIAAAAAVEGRTDQRTDWDVEEAGPSWPAFPEFQWRAGYASLEQTRAAIRDTRRTIAATRHQIAESRHLLNAAQECSPKREPTLREHDLHIQEVQRMQQSQWEAYYLDPRYRRGESAPDSTEEPS